MPLSRVLGSHISPHLVRPTCPQPIHEAGQRAAWQSLPGPSRALTCPHPAINHGESPHTLSSMTQYMACAVRSTRLQFAEDCAARFSAGQVAAKVRGGEPYVSYLRRTSHQSARNSLVIHSLDTTGELSCSAARKRAADECSKYR
jgi:hypothetical protein